MKTNNANFNDRRMYRVVWSPLLMGLVLFPSLAFGNDENAAANDYEIFQAAVKNGNDAKIAEIGDTIYEKLCRKYAADNGFRAYMSKLSAAEFLAKQMVSQLSKANRDRMASAADEIIGDSKKKSRPSLVAPAKDFYETSIKVFSLPVHISNLSKDEKEFLLYYYNFRLRSFTTEIGKAGLALSVGDPDFKGTYNYVLVLPLLHVGKTQPVNIDILPKWIKKPDQVRILSDSCLLHYGLPIQAMKLAKQVAETQKKPFSEATFYKASAKKCGTTYAKTSVECLTLAMASAGTKDRNLLVSLEFDTFQVWWDSGNYRLAAGQAKKIFTNYPDSKDYARAIQLYYTSLANSGDADTILAGIDDAINGKKCEAHKPQLLFIKWWALRRKRDQPANLAALEDKLLTLYGNNSIVAPVMFSQSMDYLANQEYDRSGAVLDEIVEKFPSSKSASQAKKILERLKAMKSQK